MIHQTMLVAMAIRMCSSYCIDSARSKKDMLGRSMSCTGLRVDNDSKMAFQIFNESNQWLVIHNVDSNF
jgi:hypothetical protein